MPCSYCLLKLGLKDDGTAEPFIRQGVLPVFGDYVLEAEIARGGMGVVYRARQISLDRTVAIKMILAGQLASPEMIQRFRLEAQSASRLRHPGIIPIYEIGESETQHYFSMEWVDGASLTECLEEFRLKAGANAAEKKQQQLLIAELMAKVARALDFAHKRGVLHRDVKPSNILVDERGEPRLTDFGLAKLIGEAAAGMTAATAVLGTPGYAAPEQGLESESEVTTAADVYGFGATLYELLTGKPPFTGPTALATMRMAGERPPVAPRQINPVVHRDLETIAMRCLETDPLRRYDSAQAVAEDLERFARGEPVLAAPPSAIYRFRKFVLRNRAAALSLTAIFVTLIFVSIVLALQSRRMAFERDRAIAARNAEEAARNLAAERQRIAEEVNAFFSVEILRQADPTIMAPQSPVTLKDAIDNAASKVEKAFDHDPLIRAMIHMSLGDSYRGMGLWNQALEQFQFAYDERRSALGGDTPETLEALHRLATGYRLKGDSASAEPLLRQLIEARRRTSGPDAPETCSAMTGLGFMYLTQNKPTDAVPLFQEAYKGQLKSLGERNIETLQTMNGLAIAYSMLNQFDQATAVVEKQLQLLKETLGNDHPETTNAEGTLAGLYAREGKFTEALTLWHQADDSEKRVLGEDHPDRILTYTNMAGTYLDSGNIEESVRIYEDALRICRTSNRIDKPAMENVMAKYAGAMIAQKHYPQAEASLLEAYQVLNAAYGPANVCTRRAVKNLVRLYQAWDKPAQAEQWQSKSLPPTTAATRKLY